MEITDEFKGLIQTYQDYCKDVEYLGRKLMVLQQESADLQFRANIAKSNREKAFLAIRSAITPALTLDQFDQPVDSERRGV